MSDAQNYRAWILAAQTWIALGFPANAVEPLQRALALANRMTPDHRRVTMRVLNWTRTAARRNGAAPCA
jgi:hypothetical protein